LGNGFYQGNAYRLGIGSPTIWRSSWRIPGGHKFRATAGADAHPYSGGSRLLP
jgi:hypothetical protein